MGKELKPMLSYQWRDRLDLQAPWTLLSLPVFSSCFLLLFFFLALQQKLRDTLFFTKDCCNTSFGVKNEVNLHIFIADYESKLHLALENRIELLVTSSPLDLPLTDMKEKTSCFDKFGVGGQPYMTKSCRHIPLLPFF